MDPLQAMNNYGMRDEQEKCFALQKGRLGRGGLRTWSEGGKSGRMFIYFVGLILASYVRSVWQKDDVLRKKFSSTEAGLPARKWIIRNYRYTKLKNSEILYNGETYYCCEPTSNAGKVGQRRWENYVVKRLDKVK